MDSTPHYRVVVHATMSPGRLPGKAFLPLGGMPSVLLCLERAANAGAETVLATSLDHTDDELARIVADSGYRVARGPRGDTLAQCILAAGDLPDEAVVVRLAADCIIPDGQLVNDVVRTLTMSDAQLAHLSWPAAGMPFGVEVEALYVHTLRRFGARLAGSDRRKRVALSAKKIDVPAVPHEPGVALRGAPQARCTLGTMPDYCLQKRLLEDADDARCIPWDSLVHRLIESRNAIPVPYKTRRDEVHSALSLGSAQFGMAYGRDRSAGAPTSEHVRQVVARAVEHGFLSIDTARSYGSSEANLGLASEYWQNGQIRMVTKLDVAVARDTEEACVLAVDASIFRSCAELELRSLDTVLLHRWSHRHACGDAIWQRLLDLKNEGVVRRIGVSVQNPEEIGEALLDEDVEHIQLPMNALDWRWREAGTPELVARRPDVVIHARSILLQGILLAESQSWPSITGVSPEEWIRRLEEVVGQLGLSSRAELCVRYVQAVDWVDSLVVGFDGVEQMDELVALSALGPLDSEAMRLVERDLAGAPAALLDPARWRERRDEE